MLTFSLAVVWVTLIALLAVRTPQGDGILLPASVISPQSFSRMTFRPSSKQADTTAIILNWSRFSNVVRIVTLLCTELENTLETIHIFNNNGTHNVSKKDFPQCAEDRIKITNSPVNLYFQARFFACAEANTPFCFIQDDDYLVLPEIIQTLRLRFSEHAASAIYLLPPYEALSSDLRRIRVDSKIHTSFAWLGHGTIIKRVQAQNFLALLQRLNVSEDEMKMADNYFSLLANVYPQVWFDQGIELGGGQAFTVGVEGDERNNRHIAQAAKFLDVLMNCIHPPCTGESFVSLENQDYSSIYRAPCVGSSCLLETTISLLPSMQIDVKSASVVLEVEKLRRDSSEQNYANDYLFYPPSHAVDGKPETSFCMPQGVKKEDVIGLDLFGPIEPKGQTAEVAFLVDQEALSILLAASPSLEFLVGDIWVKSNASFTCASTQRDSLYECSCEVLYNISAFRLVFLREVQRRGCIHEMWVRERVVSN